MKSCIGGLLVLVVAVVAGPFPGNVEQTLMDQCKKELGINEDLWKTGLKNYDKTKKCLASCILLKEGIMTIDGTFDLTYPKEYLKGNQHISKEIKKTVLKVLDHCALEVKPDPNDLCETAYKFLICEDKMFNKFYKSL